MASRYFEETQKLLKCLEKQDSSGPYLDLESPIPFNIRDNLEISATHLIADITQQFVDSDVWKTIDWKTIELLRKIGLVLRNNPKLIRSISKIFEKALLQFQAKSFATNKSKNYRAKYYKHTEDLIQILGELGLFLEDPTEIVLPLLEGFKQYLLLCGELEFTPRELKTNISIIITGRDMFDQTFRYYRHWLANLFDKDGDSGLVEWGKGLKFSDPALLLQNSEWQPNPEWFSFLFTLPYISRPISLSLVLRVLCDPGWFSAIRDPLGVTNFFQAVQHGTHPIFSLPASQFLEPVKKDAGYVGRDVTRKYAWFLECPDLDQLAEEIHEIIQSRSKEVYSNLKWAIIDYFRKNPNPSLVTKHFPHLVKHVKSSSN